MYAVIMLLILCIPVYLYKAIDMERVAQLSVEGNVDHPFNRVPGILLQFMYV